MDMMARMARHALVLCVVLGFSIAFAADHPTLAIGTVAPDFRLPGVDGKDHALADYSAAKVLVIAFTCNHCPSAQAYEERLKSIMTDYEGRGVALVAISPNDPKALRLDELGYTDLGDSLEDMKLRAEAHAFNFPYLYDGDTQATSRKFGPVSTPHVFAFDEQRVLRYTGRVDDAEDPARVKTHDLRNAIDALLAGKPVPVEKTKTIGCSTKWSDKRDTAQASLDKWNAEEVTLTPLVPTDVPALLTGAGEKLRLVNVWATWCAPCLEEMDELVEMHRMYRGRDFEVITISMDAPDRAPKALEVLKKAHCSARNYVNTVDDSYALADAIDREWEGGLPYTLLITKEGEVVFRKMGRFDALELKRAIVEVLGRTYF